MSVFSNKSNSDDKVTRSIRTVRTLTAMIGRVIGRVVVGVVKPSLPALATRLPAGELPVLAAVEIVWAMAWSKAGEIPTVQLLSDDGRLSIFASLHTPDRQPASQSVSQCVQFINGICKCTCRETQHSLKLSTRPSRLDSFAVRVVRPWNSLPEIVVTAPKWVSECVVS